MSVLWEVAAMTKLLRAGFARMFKSKLFFVLTAASAGIGLLIRIYICISEVKQEVDLSLDSAFFAIAPLLGMIMAIFCSLFIGTEYSDGTIRNKLVVGHARSTVYLSNLILCTTAGFIFTLIYFLVSLVVGIPLSGFFEAKVVSVLLMVGLTLMMCFAYTAIFVLMAMGNQNKTLVAVTTLLLAFLLFFAAAFIYSGLSEPEFYSAYSITENDVTIQEEMRANPNFLQGTKRAVYEFLFDFLPGCQSTRIGQIHSPDAEPIFALYSLLIAGIATPCGMLIFKKKNIK